MEVTTQLRRGKRSRGRPPGAANNPAGPVVAPVSDSEAARAFLFALANPDNNKAAGSAPASLITGAMSNTGEHERKFARRVRARRGKEPSTPAKLQKGTARAAKGAPASAATAREKGASAKSLEKRRSLPSDTAGLPAAKRKDLPHGHQHTNTPPSGPTTTVQALATASATAERHTESEIPAAKGTDPASKPQVTNSSQHGIPSKELRIRYGRQKSKGARVDSVSMAGEVVESAESAETVLPSPAPVRVRSPPKAKRAARVNARQVGTEAPRAPLEVSVTPDRTPLETSPAPTKVAAAVAAQLSFGTEQTAAEAASPKRSTAPSTGDTSAGLRSGALKNDRQFQPAPARGTPSPTSTAPPKETKLRRAQFRRMNHATATSPTAVGEESALTFRPTHSPTSVASLSNSANATQARQEARNCLASEDTTAPVAPSTQTLTSQWDRCREERGHCHIVSPTVTIVASPGHHCCSPRETAAAGSCPQLTHIDTFRIASPSATVVCCSVGGSRSDSPVHPQTNGERGITNSRRSDTFLKNTRTCRRRTPGSHAKKTNNKEVNSQSPVDGRGRRIVSNKGGSTSSLNPRTKDETRSTCIKRTLKSGSRVPRESSKGNKRARRGCGTAETKSNLEASGGAVVCRTSSPCGSTIEHTLLTSTANSELSPRLHDIDAAQVASCADPNSEIKVSILIPLRATGHCDHLANAHSTSAASPLSCAHNTKQGLPEDASKCQPSFPPNDSSACPHRPSLPLLSTECPASATTVSDQTCADTPHLHISASVPSSPPPSSSAPPDSHPVGSAGGTGSTTRAPKRRRSRTTSGKSRGRRKTMRRAPQTAKSPAAARHSSSRASKSRKSRTDGEPVPVASSTELQTPSLAICTAAGEMPSAATIRKTKTRLRPVERQQESKDTVTLSGTEKSAAKKRMLSERGRTRRTGQRAFQQYFTQEHQKEQQHQHSTSGQEDHVQARHPIPDTEKNGSDVMSNRGGRIRKGTAGTRCSLMIPQPGEGLEEGSNSVKAATSEYGQLSHKSERQKRLRRSGPHQRRPPDLSTPEAVSKENAVGTSPFPEKQRERLCHLLSLVNDGPPDYPFTVAATGAVPSTRCLVPQEPTPLLPALSAKSFPPPVHHEMCSEDGREKYLQAAIRSTEAATCASARVQPAAKEFTSESTVSSPRAPQTNTKSKQLSSKKRVSFVHDIENLPQHSVVTVANSVSETSPSTVDPTFPAADSSPEPVAHLKVAIPADSEFGQSATPVRTATTDTLSQAAVVSTTGASAVGDTTTGREVAADSAVNEASWMRPMNDKQAPRPLPARSVAGAGQKDLISYKQLKIIFSDRVRQLINDIRSRLLPLLWLYALLKVEKRKQLYLSYGKREPGLTSHTSRRHVESSNANLQQQQPFHQQTHAAANAGPGSDTSGSSEGVSSAPHIDHLDGPSRAACSRTGDRRRSTSGLQNSKKSSSLSLKAAMHSCLALALAAAVAVCLVDYAQRRGASMNTIVHREGIAQSTLFPDLTSSTFSPAGSFSPRLAIVISRSEISHVGVSSFNANAGASSTPTLPPVLTRTPAATSLWERFVFQMPQLRTALWQFTRGMRQKFAPVLWGESTIECILPPTSVNWGAATRGARIVDAETNGVPSPAAAWIARQLEAVASGMMPPYVLQHWEQQQQFERQQQQQSLTMQPSSQWYDVRKANRNGGILARESSRSSSSSVESSSSMESSSSSMESSSSSMESSSNSSLSVVNSTWGALVNLSVERLELLFRWWTGDMEPVPSPLQKRPADTAAVEATAKAAVRAAAEAHAKSAGGPASWSHYFPYYDYANNPAVLLVEDLAEAVEKQFYFSSSRGQVTIELARPVALAAVSIERMHAAPAATAGNACLYDPQDFSVFAWSSLRLHFNRPHMGAAAGRTSSAANATEHVCVTACAPSSPTQNSPPDKQRHGLEAAVANDAESLLKTLRSTIVRTEAAPGAHHAMTTQYPRISRASGEAASAAAGRKAVDARQQPEALATKQWIQPGGRKSTQKKEGENKATDVYSYLRGLLNRLAATLSIVKDLTALAPVASSLKGSDHADSKSIHAVELGGATEGESGGRAAAEEAPPVTAGDGEGGREDTATVTAEEELAIARRGQRVIASGGRGSSAAAPAARDRAMFARAGGPPPVVNGTEADSSRIHARTGAVAEEKPTPATANAVDKVSGSRFGGGSGGLAGAPETVSETSDHHTAETGSRNGGSARVVVDKTLRRRADDKESTNFGGKEFNSSVAVRNGPEDEEFQWVNMGTFTFLCTPGSKSQLYMLSPTCGKSPLRKRGTPAGHPVATAALGVVSSSKTMSPVAPGTEAATDALPVSVAHASFAAASNSVAAASPFTPSTRLNCTQSDRDVCGEQAHAASEPALETRAECRACGFEKSSCIISNKIKFVFHSNHSGQEYTRLYRLRVFGCADDG